MDFSRFALQNVNTKATTMMIASPTTVRPMTSQKLIASVGIKRKRSVSTVEQVVNRNEALGEGLLELYKSPGLKEERLDLIIVGINPSYHSFTKRHYYANPNNRMWPLLTKVGIVPEHFTAQDDQSCPKEAKLGFTDLLTGYCETNSSKITDQYLRNNVDNFYSRLVNHCQRVYDNLSKPTTSNSSDITTISLLEDEDGSHNQQKSIKHCAPKVIAFAGVRQFKALYPASYFSNEDEKKPSNYPSNDHHRIDSFCAVVKRDSNGETIFLDGTTSINPSDKNGSSSSVDTKKRGGITLQYGIQRDRPPGWPAELEDSIIYLLPSSSGAAAMTNEQRETPYYELAALLRELRS